ncbi:hypothetical protein TrLO_g4297 [Triparma laevis f. longispina]|uniref:Uncharacterized protein n=1 Tax=Triparma laevis f. longispina TaxID=1714387 RepID=A0A9W7A3V2_9STRA|nr:hypothetical protein TrLO_g4297 [Triparma laevis f. longispina]
MARSLSIQITKFNNLSHIALLLGAFMSFADLVFDITMINEYMGYDMNSAIATIVTVLLSLFLQCVVVYVTHKKRKRVEILREMFYVLTFIKPGVDVYRVVTKQPQPAGASLTPLDEMIYLRGIELFSECIPGCLIQTTAFVMVKQTNIAGLSLGTSILTAAFISASMSIEKDANRECRKRFPNFYGFIPLDSLWRSVAVCLLVFLIAFAQLSAKVFACALCSAESITVLAIYLVVDVCILYAFKIIRNDFLYWIPTKNMVGSVLLAMLARLTFKWSLDFTAVLQARHPYELGGAYFAFTMISTPIVCLYFGYRYLEYVEGEDVQDDLNYVFAKEQVYGGIGGLIILQVFSISMFLRLIDPQFRSTFTSFKTGGQHVVLTFQTTTNERAKIGVFNNHRSLWRVIEGDVKKWLNENLVIWIRDRPPWFNSGARAMILDEFVENPEMLRRITLWE